MKTLLLLAVLSLCACVKSTPAAKCVDPTTGKASTEGYVYCFQPGS